MKLVLKNITKEFDGNNVIENISYEFEKGKIYGLVGKNGSGKTVLFKIICGFYYPNSGEILLDNYNYIDKNEFIPNTRALIDKPSFLPDLTGYENLKLLASIQNKIGEKEILKALDEVNLSEEKDKKYSKYSVGMKQKLGIAQVIMEDPDIMILDEPFSGIEDETANKIRKYLVSIKKEKIIIIATHIKEDINNLSDKVIELKNGKLIEK